MREEGTREGGRGRQGICLPRRQAGDIEILKAGSGRQTQTRTVIFQIIYLVNS